MRMSAKRFINTKRALWGENLNDVVCGGLDLLGCEIAGRRDHVGGEVTIPTAGAEYTDAKTVAAVQSVLVKRGYDIGTSGPNSDGVDGVLGKKTRAAIKRMQSDANLVQSGKIDEGVIMALKVTPGVLPPGVTLQGRAAVQAQVALDAATAAEHAVTPSDAQKAAQQVADVSAAAAPPPPPDVQAKVQTAVAKAKAAKTPAEVASAAQEVKSAAEAVKSAVMPWYKVPAWQGGPPTWQVACAGGAAGGALGALLYVLVRR